MPIINQVIQHLVSFCDRHNVDSLFVVGDYCRNWYLGDNHDLQKIDVVSAYEDQTLQLGRLFSTEVLRRSPTQSSRAGSVSCTFQNNDQTVEIEFQSKSPSLYMANQEIKDWMLINRIDDTPLINNIYGRDFTINGLVFSIARKNMYDPTGRATGDLERENISSLLPSEMLIKYNPMSAFRAIRLSLIYDLRIDDNLRHEIKNIKQTIFKSVPEERVLEEIVRILKIGDQKALDILRQYDLDSLILHSKFREIFDAKNTTKPD